MGVPERFSQLPEYAFARLRALLEEECPGADPINMSIGEPRHAFPGPVLEAIKESAAGFGRYPSTDGTPELRGAISDWLLRRYGAEVDRETRIVVLSGSRDGLFGACLALCPETLQGNRPLVLIPNPFYQVYAASAAAAGAEPYYVPATRETGFLPDYASLPPEALDRCALAFLCSPSNPQGAVASLEYLTELIQLAERHGFCVLADECYSEIYRSDPPPGALEALAAAKADENRVAVFHSLSKRSNLPGLRSGFMAGGAAAMSRVKFLRSYSGPSIPGPLQEASRRAWEDEEHVRRNRELYRSKFALADGILAGLEGYDSPEAGFFLWLETGDGEEAALRLWKRAGVRVLPGEYLGSSAGGFNPGAGYIRVALVAGEEELKQGLERIRDCLH